VLWQPQIVEGSRWNFPIGTAAEEAAGALAASHPQGPPSGEKAYRALPQGGAMLVYDMLIDDERRNCPTGLLSSLNMLVWTSAGFGYSGADCAEWMHKIGFRRTRVEPLAIGQSMIIGIK
jgi:hypothetical protein